MKWEHQLKKKCRNVGWSVTVSKGSAKRDETMFKGINLKDVN